ncbi:hypothetical protein FS837_007106, partial [Tulasnella sp. UAMH 9824]
MDAVPLDVAALVLVQTSLAFITAPFTSPTYNFPLFLFGIYATENKESSEPLRLFSALVGLSFLFDLIWLFRHDYNGLIGFILVIAMLGKVVWSMPGGFAGPKPGYQNIDEDLETAPGAPSQPPPPPPSNLPGPSP